MKNPFAFLSVILAYFTGGSTPTHDASYNLTNMKNMTNVSNQPYSYYMLEAQNWCGEGYMIHGLWPQYNSTSYPSWCENVTYTKPQGDLYYLMSNYWKSCDNRYFNSSSLWQHEWEKHGSCVNQHEKCKRRRYEPQILIWIVEKKVVKIVCIVISCIHRCIVLFKSNYRIVYP